MKKTKFPWYKSVDDSLFHFKLWLDSRVDPICRVIDKNSESILDIGCGQGYPMRLIHMIMRPKTVVGVDLFEDYLKEAKVEKIHDKYVISDIRKMKFPENSFDVVLASQVIEHLPKKDGPSFVRSLEKIAKKQVIISTPIGKMFHPAVDGNKLQQHLSHYYPKDFEKLGYKIVKYGRKSILGNAGIVHKVKRDLIKKIIFLGNIIFSPLYYIFPDLADYYFVAYKNF